MLNHLIQELITKAIEKQAEKIITKKTSKQIQKDANTFNKPHFFVSGYYQAYAFLLVLPILIIVLLFMYVHPIEGKTLRYGNYLFNNFIFSNFYNL